MGVQGSRHLGRLLLPSQAISSDWSSPRLPVCEVTPAPTEPTGISLPAVARQSSAHCQQSSCPQQCTEHSLVARPQPGTGPGCCLGARMPALVLWVRGCPLEQQSPQDLSGPCRVAQGGTLSAPPWRALCWERRWTFTEEGSTCGFPTTTTSWHSRR